MANIGERGPTGDHGQTGSTGERGQLGERGPMGDHGQEGAQGHAGERGLAGDPGPRGTKGDRGLPYTSWLTRRATLAYTVMAMGIIMAFGFAEYRYDGALARIDLRARQFCEVGNLRSQLTLEETLESRKQTRAFDFAKMFNVSKEQGEEFRRLSLESNERRLRAIPFLDCDTGRILPPVTAP